MPHVSRLVSPRVALAVLALAALLATVAATGIADAGKRVQKGPPIPRLITDSGKKHKAARGSFCWRGTRRAICADFMDPLRRAPRIRVRRRGTLEVHMRYPARRVRATTRAGRAVRVERIRHNRRKYILTPPRPSERRFVGIYMHAAYDRGESLFGVRVGPRGKMRR